MTDKPKFVKPKITNKFRKQVMADWIECIPSLQILRTGGVTISRKIGPLLVNVSFDEKSDREQYYPLFGTHNLCNEIKFLTVTLSSPLRTIKTNAPDWITVRGHEAGNYVEAAARMKSQSPIPLEGPVSLSQILKAYRDFVDRGMGISSSELYDPCMIAAWAGKIELAEQLFKFGHEKFAHFGEHAKENLGGYDAWGKKVWELIHNPERLRAIAHEQAIFHKVDHLPEEELIIDL